MTNDARSRFLLPILTLTWILLAIALVTPARAQEVDQNRAEGTKGTQGTQPPVTQTPPAAPDSRTQYPSFLANAFVGGYLSYVNYHFTAQQLEPGNTAGFIAVPHLGARIDLLGYHVNRFVSVQAEYMRPAAFVTYTNVNGDQQSHHVWMNFGAATVQGSAPIGDRVSAYLEGGLGIASRRGFDDGHGNMVVRHAHYATPVLGAGLMYHAGPSWDLTAGLSFIPHHLDDKQPASAFVSTGVRYNIGAGSAPRLDAAGSGDADSYIFPKQLLQFEISTGGGYSVNKFFSSKVPIFWDGNVEIDQGLAVHYERNIYHTRKLFALDLGTSGSFWQSRGLGDTFATMSVYPLLRFTVVRTKLADYFLMYSVAGPTYISKRLIDGLGTGGNFTFQDFMGVGAFIGDKRNVSLGFKITHYSNGNLFVDNAGLKVPLTVDLGYAF